MQLLLRKMLGQAVLKASPVKKGIHSAGSAGALTGPDLLAAPCDWALIQAETGCCHADLVQHYFAGRDCQGLTPVLTRPQHRCHQL